MSFTELINFGLINLHCFDIRTDGNKYVSLIIKRPEVVLDRHSSISSLIHRVWGNLGAYPFGALRVDFFPFLGVEVCERVEVCEQWIQ